MDANAARQQGKHGYEMQGQPNMKTTQEDRVHQMVTQHAARVRANQSSYTQHGDKMKKHRIGSANKITRQSTMKNKETRQSATSHTQGSSTYIYTYMNVCVHSELNTT